MTDPCGPERGGGGKALRPTGNSADFRLGTLGNGDRGGARRPASQGVDRNRVAGPLVTLPRYDGVASAEPLKIGAIVEVRKRNEVNRVGRILPALEIVDGHVTDPHRIRHPKRPPSLGSNIARPRDLRFRVADECRLKGWPNVREDGILNLVELQILQVIDELIHRITATFVVPGSQFQQLMPPE